MHGGAVEAEGSVPNIHHAPPTGTKERVRRSRDATTMPFNPKLPSNVIAASNDKGGPDVCRVPVPDGRKVLIDLNRGVRLVAS